MVTAQSGRAVKAYGVSICHACNHGCIPVLPSADADARSDKGRVGPGQRVACQSTQHGCIPVYKSGRSPDGRVFAGSGYECGSTSPRWTTSRVWQSASFKSTHSPLTQGAAVFDPSRSDGMMFAEADEHTRRGCGHDEVSSRWGYRGGSERCI
jgi:hypothetical protein